ncbi:MAG: hypothetical protein ACLFUH_06585 [Bacteroidales bacterium]
MRYVIYNTDTNEPGPFRKSPYLVDGKPGKLPSHKVELTVVEKDKPTVEDTEIAESKWVADLENKEYRKEWRVRDKTEKELALENWRYPDFKKRITAPKSLVIEYPGIEAWFRINDLPITKDNGTITVYVNRILEEHQSFVDENEDKLTIEDRPEILD